MKKIIFTDKAPTPIGPYSQAVLAGNMLYISGQVPINPSSGKLMMSSIEEQTQQVMENLKAILSAADMTFDNVVKSTIFIMNMDDFSKINTVYGAYFSEGQAPARETVQVAKLPRSVDVEISMIAIR